MDVLLSCVLLPPSPLHNPTSSILTALSFHILPQTSYPPPIRRELLQDLLALSACSRECCNILYVDDVQSNSDLSVITLTFPRHLGVSLLELVKRSHRPLPEAALWNIAISLLLSLKKLHYNNLFGDLSLSNVYIASDGLVCLDGVSGVLCKGMDPSLYTTLHDGLLDTHSLGMILFALTTSNHLPEGLWEGVESGELCHTICSQLIPTTYSEELRYLIERLLSPRPSSRPSVEAVLGLQGVRDRMAYMRIFFEEEEGEGGDTDSETDGEIGEHYDEAEEGYDLPLPSQPLHLPLASTVAAPLALPPPSHNPPPPFSKDSTNGGDTSIEKSLSSSDMIRYMNFDLQCNSDTAAPPLKSRSEERQPNSLGGGEAKPLSKEEMRLRHERALADARREVFEERKRLQAKMQGAAISYKLDDIMGEFRQRRDSIEAFTNSCRGGVASADDEDEDEGGEAGEEEYYDFSVGAHGGGAEGEEMYMDGEAVATGDHDSHSTGEVTFETARIGGATGTSMREASRSSSKSSAALEDRVCGTSTNSNSNSNRSANPIVCSSKGPLSTHLAYLESAQRESHKLSKSRAMLESTIKSLRASIASEVEMCQGSVGSSRESYGDQGSNTRVNDSVKNLLQHHVDDARLNVTQLYKDMYSSERLRKQREFESSLNEARLQYYADKAELEERVYSLPCYGYVEGSRGGEGGEGGDTTVEGNKELSSAAQENHIKNDSDKGNGSIGIDAEPLDLDCTSLDPLSSIPQAMVDQIHADVNRWLATDFSIKQ